MRKCVNGLDVRALQELKRCLATVSLPRRPLGPLGPLGPGSPFGPMVN